MQSAIYIGSHQWNPIRFKKTAFFSQCGGKSWRKHQVICSNIACDIFFPFSFGRDMQITKGTVSHLSWER